MGLEDQVSCGSLRILRLCILIVCRSASDTLNGATSQDVHSGYGHPGQGQTSAQIHHDGVHSHRKRAEEGLGRYGQGDESVLRNSTGDQV